MIWVVSENPDIAGDLRELIQNRGYDVDVLSSSREVTRRMQFRSPSLVIAECNSAADGFEMVSIVRATPKVSVVPVVIFAALTDVAWRAVALRGADAVVTKGPLDWADLLREIRRLAGSPNSANRT